MVPFLPLDPCKDVSLPSCGQLELLLEEYVHVEHLRHHSGALGEGGGGEEGSR